MKEISHCVFVHTTLKYDGRVCALINTLSIAYPDDKIYIYGIEKVSGIVFRKNVSYSNLVPLSIPKLRMILFSIFSFFVLLYRNPKTIQIHHEDTILGPLCYLLLNRKVKVIYDDKELYHLKDKNTNPTLFKLETILIKKVDLIIFANEYRKRAIQIMFKKNLNNIIIENYVFDPSVKKLDEGILQQLNKFKTNNKKILMHQGLIDKNRGASDLVSIIDNLPEDWVLIFVGVSKLIFDNFFSNLTNRQRNKIHNFGFVPYDQLNSFWMKVNASVIFYNIDTFNNKYCAPNRLYSSANAGVPIIANRDNVTLRTFIEKYSTGILVPPVENIMDFFSKYNEYRLIAQSYKDKFQHSNGKIQDLENFYLSLL